MGGPSPGRRDEAFIATKLFPVLPLAPIVEWRGQVQRPPARDRDDRPLPAAPAQPGRPACHRDGRHAPLLVAAGVVRRVGVSNFSLARWQAAEAAFAGPVLSNQVRYNLVDRQPLQDLVPWAAGHDRLVIAYSPLGQGLLSARYDATNAPRLGYGP